MIDLPIMRNHQSPPPSPPPDSIFKRNALISSQRPRVSSLNRAFTAHVDAAEIRLGSFEALASEPGSSSPDEVFVGADLVRSVDAEHGHVPVDFLLEQV